MNKAMSAHRAANTNKLNDRRQMTTITNIQRPVIENERSNLSGRTHNFPGEAEKHYSSKCYNKMYQHSRILSTKSDILASPHHHSH
ncbi:unnamed protein product [Brugia timori]|uniref:Ovule protein n=1 Tax=Brugia timori TaxID=42155 RepID=A0A0R3Q591_9BILA|nr:unnamed protein product [Brugia timori]